MWEGSDGTTPVTMTADLNGDGRSAGPYTLASGGALPAAAEAGGQLFVAYIGGDEGDQAIWLRRPRL